MTYDEIVAEVIRMTSRPDKADDISRLVNSAVNFCCIEGNFARDRDEVVITPVTPTDYVHSISLSDLTRFRKFDYIRPSNRNKYLVHTNPAEVFIQLKELTDVYYVTGDTVKLRLCQPAPTILIGYAQFPPTLGASLQTFWLTDVSPYMIIDKAASDLYAEVGNTAEATRLAGLFATAFESAKRDYRYGVNYG